MFGTLTEMPLVIVLGMMFTNRFSSGSVLRNFGDAATKCSACDVVAGCMISIPAT